MSPADAVREVLEVVRGGGLAVVPFDVSYAFLAATRGALERIYALKLRPGSKPCPLLASWEHFLDASSAEHGRIRVAERVASAGLPVGILTPLEWESAVVRSIPEDCRDLLIKDDKMALLINMGGISDLWIAAADAAGVRLFGSSANISGTGNSFRLEEVPSAMLDSVDITCEAGMCRYANPERSASSIIDVETGALVRAGILHEEIGRLLRETDESTTGC